MDDVADEVMREAEEMLKQYEANGGTLSTENKSVKQQQAELDLLEDAIRLVALRDFKAVADKQAVLSRFEERRRADQEGYAEPESDVEFRKMQSSAGKKSKMTRSSGKAPPAVSDERAVLNFWDGAAVGVWGAVHEAWLPSKKAMFYAGCAAGH
jgi:hypothetical protein